MIFGGKWKNQDKITPGVFINFISGKKSINQNNPNLPNKDNIAILGKAVLNKMLLNGGD